MGDGAESETKSEGGDDGDEHGVGGKMITAYQAAWNVTNAIQVQGVLFITPHFLKFNNSRSGRLIFLKFCTDFVTALRFYRHASETAFFRLQLKLN